MTTIAFGSAQVYVGYRGKEQYMSLLKNKSICMPNSIEIGAILVCMYLEIEEFTNIKNNKIILDCTMSNDNDGAK